MTRSEALIIAKANHAAYRAATLAALFHNGPEVNDADFGHRHGWFCVDGHTFNEQDITGVAYDMHQGGWAWV